MNIPEVPIAPLELDEEAKEFIISLEGRLGTIEAIGIEGKDVFVLGRPGWVSRNFFEIVYNKDGYDRESSFKSVGVSEIVLPIVLTLGLFQLTPWMSARRHKEKEYREKVENFKAKNLADAEAKLEHIKVYQVDASFLEKQLGKSLEIIELSQAEQFLEAENILNLRAAAYRVGANAITNFQEFETRYTHWFMGTPVKFAEKR